MKKLSALVLTIIMLLMCISPVYALDIASVYPYMSDVQIDPGNPRSDNPEYEFSWLDNVIIRYDPNAVTSTPVTPVPSDYLYSETFEEFCREVDNYSLLFELNEKTVGAAYQEITTALFYTFTAMGFTDKQENMRKYLSEYGISLPANETAEDKVAIAVVYGALKYDAIYVLYEKKVSFPVGTTLDEATVIILSALTGTMLPSGVDSVTGFATLVMKNYVTQFEQLPISDDPDASEIFHWAKVITAAQNEYQVPLDAYNDTTKAQKEYVDYAYYASILNTLYDINVDPIHLVIAMQSEEKNSLQKFILRTMLDEKKVSYSKNATCAELFNLACKNGFFDLEQEFYTDIFFYELKVPASCEKVWFTPFSLAGQLNGSDVSYVTIYLNGKQMSPNSTVSTPLDPSKAAENVELKVVYDDKISNKSETVYTYKVIKDKTLDIEKQENEANGLVGEVQQFVDTIVPNGNNVANQKVDEVFSAIDSAASELTTNVNSDVLTTYGVEATNVSELLSGYEITTAQKDEAATSSSQRFDSKYLEELIGGVYATDADGNIITTKALSSDDEENEDKGVIGKVTETVKESPEIVAVPSSLIATFSFIGYFMSKKHRDVDAYAEKEEEETEE